MAPVICYLHLQERTRRPEVGLDTAEFPLEQFRIAHCSRGANLPPTGVGELGEFVHGAFGHTHGEGAVRHRNEFQHVLIERPRQAGHAILDIEEVASGMTLSAIAM